VIFTETKLKGAYIIEPELHVDERGFFARTWCEAEARAHGLDPAVVQCNISFNKRKGTLRGMHYQTAPFAEAKLVRCTSGAIFDAIIDLRSDSPTYRHHFAVVLSADNRRMLYMPEGFAHGFQTLEDDTEVAYQMSCAYSPDHGRGVRWNDPAFGIDWPEPDPIINQRDMAYPDFGP
jgi:dTDP-4-dehydrorhamnose 3,5-epimerase